ncbi:MAG TPA: hypothetical protein VNU64_22930 [Burkholderiales bacterium]|nr:hypothetical protein [Burkholderiales bacterium]
MRIAALFILAIDFGGKSAVLFDDLDRGFASLSVGRRLGLTIICLSVLIAFLLTWIARRR